MRAEPQWSGGAPLPPWSRGGARGARRSPSVNERRATAARRIRAAPLPAISRGAGGLHRSCEPSAKPRVPRIRGCGAGPDPPKRRGGRASFRNGGATSASSVGFRQRVSSVGGTCSFPAAGRLSTEDGNRRWRAESFACRSATAGDHRLCPVKATGERIRLPGRPDARTPPRGRR